MTVRLLNSESHVTVPLYHHLAIVKWERSMYDDFVAGVEQASREFDLPRPSLSAMGVDILFEHGVLVEADVTAAIDRPTSAANEEGGTSL